MIFDTLSHLPQYLPPNVWQTLAPFVENIRPGMPKGEHVLRKPDIFARISSYETVPIQEARFESHRRYIDIQIILTGSEIIEVTPLSALLPITEYDETNDVQFYNTSDNGAVRLTMVPGNFALFFPQDAHCPGLSPQVEPQNVGKVVIKIAVEPQS